MGVKLQRCQTATTAPNSKSSCRLSPRKAVPPLTLSRSIWHGRDLRHPHPPLQPSSWRVTEKQTQIHEKWFAQPRLQRHFCCLYQGRSGNYQVLIGFINCSAIKCTRSERRPHPPTPQPLSQTSNLKGVALLRFVFVTAAEVAKYAANVPFWHLANITTVFSYVCFLGQSGHDHRFRLGSGDLRRLKFDLDQIQDRRGRQ